jgi:hypothetical protein
MNPQVLAVLTLEDVARKIERGFSERDNPISPFPAGMTLWTFHNHPSRSRKSRAGGTATTKCHHRPVRACAIRRVECEIVSEPGALRRMK